jgi:integrase
MASPAEAPTPAIPSAEQTAASARRSEIATLADVLRELEAAPEPTRKHGEMRSAVKMVGKVLGRPLRDIPANPAELRKSLAAANPAQAAMTRYRWIRVRSLVLAALGAVGLDVMPGRDAGGLSPAWLELAGKLPTKRLRIGLSRLMSFFSRRSLAPEDIDATHLERFKIALGTASLDPAPQTTFNSAARLWNEAADIVEGWPRAHAKVEADPRRYSLAWDAFSEPFVADVRAFLDHGGSQDPLSDDYVKSVRPATIEGRQRMIRQFASALVNSGFPVEGLTSLGVLVEPANAKAAFRYLLDRSGGTTSPQIANTSILLRTISRHWVKVPADADAAIQKLASALQVKSKGMRPKNRERLRQFDLDENLKALLLLPARVLEEVRRSDKGGKGEAVRVMMALAVEILTMAPMRLKNVVGLEVDRHLVTVRRAGKTSRHIVIPAEETKTEAPFEMALPLSSVALLDAYLTTYRERVCDYASPYLFPGRAGRRRSDTSFAALLTKFLKRELGVTMHTHLFRHLAAKVHLEARPEDIESVRQILGHTTTRTTLRAYAELKSDAAFRRYDETIMQRRDAATRASASRPSRDSQRASR